MSIPPSIKGLILGLGLVIPLSIGLKWFGVPLPVQIVLAFVLGYWSMSRFI